MDCALRITKLIPDRNMGKEFGGSIPARVITSILLFLALLHWPYGYYQLLRWVVCGVCSWLVVLAMEAKKPGWVWVMGLTAVLFNPIVPIYLSRRLWTVIDITVATILLVSVRYFGYRIVPLGSRLHDIREEKPNATEEELAWEVVRLRIANPSGSRGFDEDEARLYIKEVPA